MTFTQCWFYYASHTSTQQPAIHPASMNWVFANHSKEDVIYPLTVKEIAEAQETDPNIHKFIFLCKSECCYEHDPWTITSVHTNGTIRVQHKTKSE